MKPAFTARQRLTLDALCRRIIPAAFEHRGREFDLPGSVESRLESGSQVVFRQFAALLGLFGSPLCTLLFRGRFIGFASLGADAQDKVLHGWERSRIGLRRTIFQAFRRIILSSYYAMPEAHAEIRFKGPLYLREREVPWEGVLSGVTSDAEPVARTQSNERAYHQEVARIAVANSQQVPAGVTQARDVHGDAEITADVCVVGSGAGGAAAAARLAEAGYDVVILEEGGYWREADFTEQEHEMVPRLYAERGTRATEDLSISILQGRAVGGSTLVNWMIMLRTPDWVLEEWTRDYGTEGMGPAEMSKLFALVEDDVHSRPVPADAHAPNNSVILDGAARAGWKASSTAINAKGCIRAGFCGLGCRYGAKQSTLLTYIPRALAAGARLYADCSVERIETLETGGRAPLKRVSGYVIDRETREPLARVSVRAPLVVLAGGAVGTPTILQRSAMGGGGVGKFLRLHPTTAVIGRFDREMYGAAGIPQSALSDHFIRSNDGYGFWIECPALLPGLAAAAIPGFGAGHRQVMQDFPNLASLIVLQRDGSDGNLSNGSVVAGKRGGTKIHYTMGRNDLKSLVGGIGAAARIHFEAGAREVLTLHSPQISLKDIHGLGAVANAPSGPNQLGLFSAHVNGTCRIGKDPSMSGCTPDGERYGAAGVYVADGSLFPTAPGVNPQATIMALATLVAQRIIARHPLSALTTPTSIAGGSTAARS